MHGRVSPQQDRQINLQIQAQGERPGERLNLPGRAHSNRGRGNVEHRSKAARNKAHTGANRRRPEPADGRSVLRRLRSKTLPQTGRDRTV
ncbi:MAG: hypothetical protein LBP36_02920 [Oscillospiraceae bacterium]|nr:hypothetical protein [Oscillospiraceae bacterium]